MHSFDTLQWWWFFGSRHQFAEAVEGEYEWDEGGDQDGRDGQR